MPRTDTVWLAVSPLVIFTPSKFVATGADDNCTTCGVVTPKKGGRLVMAKVSGRLAEETVPGTLVKRKVSISAFKLAGTDPEAAVKLVTRTATVCPGTRIEASVPPKELAGTVRPLLSTVKALTPETFTVASEPSGKFDAIREPVVSRTKSLVTNWNCVVDPGAAITTPSTQSCVVVLVSKGSNSSIVSEPSAFKAASMLATSPATAQAMVSEEQLGEKSVEELAVTVSVPRLAVCNVTIWPFTVLTTPETFSMKSSCPVDKLVEVAGSAEAEMAFVAFTLTAVTAWVVALTVSAWARLTLKAKPVSCAEARLTGEVKVAEGATLVPATCFTLPATQPGVPETTVQ